MIVRDEIVSECEGNYTLREPSGIGLMICARTDHQDAGLKLYFQINPVLDEIIDRYRYVDGSVTSWSYQGKAGPCLALLMFLKEIDITS